MNSARVTSNIMHSNTDGKLSIIFERENVTLSKNMNNNNQSLSLSSEKVKSTTAVCVSAEGCFVFLQPELTRFDGTSATFDFFRSADCGLFRFLESEPAGGLRIVSYGLLGVVPLVFLLFVLRGLIFVGTLSGVSDGIVSASIDSKESSDFSLIDLRGSFLVGNVDVFLAGDF